MSLSRTLIQTARTEAMENGTLYEYINPSAYQCEHAASIIAMETSEALHDVFLESYYGAEQADLLAIKDGVLLEGSQYESIVEGLSVEALDKIKKIISTIREKAQAFIDYIIRQIDGVVMDTANFFKKHDAELQRLKGLTGFKFTMYEYNDSAFENFLEDTTAKSAKICKSSVNGLRSFLSNVSTGNQISADEGTSGAIDTLTASLQNMSSDENLYKSFLGHDVKDSKEFKTAVFGIFRNGAKSPEDKKELEITDVYAKIQVVRNFNPESVKKVRNKNNEIFNDAISTIDMARNNTAKMSGPNASKTAEVCRMVSTVLSKTQNMQNTFITEWNVAVKERDAVYKQMVMKALAYARASK